MSSKDCSQIQEAPIHISLTLIRWNDQINEQLYALI